MHVGVNLYRYLCQLLVSCFLASITFTSNHIHILTVVIFTSMETSTPFASYKSMLSMLSIGSSVINFYPTASTLHGVNIVCQYIICQYGVNIAYYGPFCKFSQIFSHIKKKQKQVFIKRFLKRNLAE